MIVGTPIHKAQLAENYDVVVIGSGIGGLTSAACLSKAGKKVLVLEKHYTAGGFTHTYSRRGYEWDVGVHYIGEVHREGSVLKKMFDYISDGMIEWAQMDDVYDRVYLGDESYDFVSGRERFRNKMVAYFPEEEQAIDRYMQLLQNVSKSSPWFYLEKALPLWIGSFLYQKLAGNYLKYAGKTTDEVLRTLTKNRRLISVLTGQWGDYGLPPKESSFGMHGIVAKHYLAGAAYPVGGSSSIAKSIVPTIEKAGGLVVTRAEVEQILLRGSKAVGVLLASGREVKADVVISGVGVDNTYRHLIPKPVVESLGLAQNLQTVSHSMAHVCLYIGLKGSDRELGLASTNMWVYPDGNHDENVQKFRGAQSLEFPVVYISFPSSKDPNWLSKFPDKSTIEIVAPAPYTWFEKWQGTKWQNRGADYKAFKQEITDVLLKSLYKKLPHLEGRIHFTELSTPLSTVHFSNYSKGEIYGLNHDPHRFKTRWLRIQSPVKNLFLTGQDIVTCGVGGALFSGILTSLSILGPWRGRALLGLLKHKRKRMN